MVYEYYYKKWQKALEEWPHEYKWQDFIKMLTIYVKY